jgi:hypothetical protein
MPPRSYFLGMLLLVIGYLTGCDRDSRLHGKWVFDREYTEANGASAPGPTTSAEKDPMGAMKGQLATMLVPQLIEQLDGSTMTVTGKEMFFVFEKRHRPGGNIRGYRPAGQGSLAGQDFGR